MRNYRTAIVVADQDFHAESAGLFTVSWPCHETFGDMSRDSISHGFILPRQADSLLRGIFVFEAVSGSGDAAVSAVLSARPVDNRWPKAQVYSLEKGDQEPTEVCVRTAPTLALRAERLLYLNLVRWGLDSPKDTLTGDLLFLAVRLEFATIAKARGE